ncbi:hypothetical protein Hdeb2414_s0010g00342851 [Helianthus debilis subsp. tardiflorus]
MPLCKVLHREEQLYTWFVKIRQEGKKRSLKFSRAPVTKPKCSLGEFMRMRRNSIWKEHSNMV